MRPLLARPWVHIHSPTDLAHRPSWLSLKQMRYAEELFARGVQPSPVLVASTLGKMKSATPQVAFCGRSNVGKSTLLNMLLYDDPDPLKGRRPMSERKKLRNPMMAPVSHKPGRTRHLFRFEIGGRMTLVDLPGYGYAAAPWNVRASWASLANDYLAEARHLERVVSLIDARHGIKDSDEQLWDMLLQFQRPLMVVLTKADRTGPEGLNRVMAQVVSVLQRLEPELVWPYVHAVSGLHGHGVAELRASLSAVASDFDFAVGRR